jgi:hypothetical protein
VWLSSADQVMTSVLIRSLHENPVLTARYNQLDLLGSRDSLKLAIINADPESPNSG